MRSRKQLCGDGEANADFQVAQQTYSKCLGGSSEARAASVSGVRPPLRKRKAKRKCESGNASGRTKNGGLSAGRGPPRNGFRSEGAAKLGRLIAAAPRKKTRITQRADCQVLQIAD